MSFHSTLFVNSKAGHRSFIFLMSIVGLVSSVLLPATTRARTSTKEMAQSTNVNGHCDRYVADTCGGIIHIPLSFDRLSSFQSPGFPAPRDYPTICRWNVQVKDSQCRRARLTIRLDGRSRLADGANCTRGHFTVLPYMKECRLCGRMGNISPFRWYLHVQQPEKNVIIVMKNMGINDGHSEGVSFSLQGECVPAKFKKMNVDDKNARTHARWLSRLLEDIQTGEGVRIVQAANQTTKRRHSTTARPETNQRRTVTHRTPSTTTKRSIVYVDSDLLWPSVKSTEPFISSESLIDSQPSSLDVGDDATSLAVQSSTEPSVNRFESTNASALVITTSSPLTGDHVLHPTNQPIHLNETSSGHSLNSVMSTAMKGTIPSPILDDQPNVDNLISYISLNGQKFIFSQSYNFRKLLP